MSKLSAKYSPLFFSLVFLIIFIMTSVKVGSGHGFVSDITAPADSILYITHEHITDEPFGINLRQCLSILQDPSANLGFNEILALGAKFRDPGASLASRLPKVEGSTWLKLSIESQALGHSEWYLGVASPYVDYYIQVDGHGWKSDQIGTHRRNASAMIDLVSIPIIPVSVGGGERIDIIFRVTPGTFSYVGHDQFWRFNLILSNKSNFYQYKVDRLWKIIPVIFILFSVFIYHLVLFLFNRIRTFLWLGLSALGASSLIVNDNDVLADLFDFHYGGQIIDFQMAAVYSFTLLILCLFTISYLVLKYRSFWRIFLIGSTASGLIFWSIVLIIRLVSFNEYWGHAKLFEDFFNLFNIVTTFSLLVVAVVAVFRGKSLAIYFLSGIGTITVGYLLTIAFSMGYLFNDNSNLPTAFGYLMFAFGLAREFKLLQDQRIESDKQRALANQMREVERQEAQRLKELDQFKSQLYTNITHEFRTPLTVISGMADQMPEGNEEKVLIQRNANNLLDLVNQMLDLSKVDAGQLRPDPIQCDVIPHIKYLAETYHHLAHHRGKFFHLELLNETLWMDNDPLMLERIVNNLVHNAIKFTPTGGDVKLRVMESKNDSSCLIEIHDTGQGIPQDQQEKIFDRFYQIDSSSTRYGEGTGIGLSLAQELAHLLGGQITVESRVKRGTTFTLSLPITRSEKLGEWSSRDTAKGKQHLFSSKNPELPLDAAKILLIEDHTDVRHYLHTLLKGKYHLIEADNGRQGISKALAEVPDIIISDIMMPELDGLAVCKQLKSDTRTSHIPFILLTARSTQDDRLQGLMDGADAFLIKPFDKKELFIRIDKLLENREQMRAHFQKFQILPSEVSTENKFLDKVRTAVEDNLSNENFQIDDLATSLHVSRTQLYRKLKALTGSTFSEILKAMRIRRAQELLQKTDKSIGEIAYKVGFRDQSYFAKVFKDAVGRTPSEMRTS